MADEQTAGLTEVSYEGERRRAATTRRAPMPGPFWSAVVLGVLFFPIGAVVVFSPLLGAILAVGSAIWAVLLFVRMREASCPSCEAPIRTARKTITCAGCRNRLVLWGDKLVDCGPAAPGRARGPSATGGR